MKKAISAILGVSLVCGLLAGCGAAKEAEPKTTTTESKEFQPKLDSKIEGELRVGGIFKNFEALEEVFVDFQKYYPNVETSYYSIDNQSEVVNKVISGEEAPDILFSSAYIWDYSDQYEEVQNHALVLSDPDLDIDLSAIHDEYLLKNDKGELRFYPAFILASGVMVNEKILDDNKIEMPKTYTEFMDACKALQKAGYEYPVAGTALGNGWEALYPAIAQGYFTQNIFHNPEAIEAINNKKPEAEKYLRETLEFVETFKKENVIDEEVSESLQDGYESVILRFFEGDIPFMFTNTNTMTGTAKREKKSEAFTQHPFSYCFMPFPYDEKGGILPVRDMFGFTVNKEGPNKDMAVEFMRFLSQKDVLDKFCDLKGSPRITKNAEQLGKFAPLTDYDGRIECDGQGLTRNEAEAVRNIIVSVGNGTSIDAALKEYYS